MGINLCRLKSQSTVIFGLEVIDQICFNKFVIATIIVIFCGPQVALRLQGLISIYMKQIVNLLCLSDLYLSVYKVGIQEFVARIADVCYSTYKRTLSGSRGSVGNPFSFKCLSKTWNLLHSYEYLDQLFPCFPNGKTLWEKI